MLFEDKLLNFIQLLIISLFTINCASSFSNQDNLEPDDQVHFNIHQHKKKELDCPEEASQYLPNQEVTMCNKLNNS